MLNNLIWLLSEIVIHGMVENIGCEESFLIALFNDLLVAFLWELQVVRRLGLNLFTQISFRFH